MGYLKIKNVYKNFGDTKVLSSINLEVEKGEFVTLLGPSGCGKSTLLRCIAGLSRQDSGMILLEGKDITNLNPKCRNISMVFQNYALFPNMNVCQNISFGLRMKKLPKKDIVKKVMNAIELVQLEGKETAYPSQLSGGQQQRVALARAIVMEPKVLLMDEPLSALDARIRKKLRSQIRNIQKELDITTIFVTHDQEEALTMSDRIFLMNGGKIAQQGTPNEVYISPKDEFAANFMGNYNIINRKHLSSSYSNKLAGELYAVRPEAIDILDGYKDEENSIVIKGKFSYSMILGNVVRYIIKSDENLFAVDMLNRSDRKSFAAGDEVIIKIPFEELRMLA